MEAAKEVNKMFGLGFLRFGGFLFLVRFSLSFNFLNLLLNALVETVCHLASLAVLGGWGMQTMGKHRGRDCHLVAEAQVYPQCRDSTVKCAFFSYPPMTSTAFSFRSVCLTAS